MMTKIEKVWFFIYLQMCAFVDGCSDWKVADEGFRLSLLRINCVNKGKSYAHLIRKFFLDLKFHDFHQKRNQGIILLSWSLKTTRAFMLPINIQKLFNAGR